MKRSLTLFIASGIFITVIGIIVMVGWVFNIEIFRSIFPGCAAMKFNTALCLSLLGLSFLFLLKYNSPFLKNIFRAMVGFVLVFAAISWSQDIFHWSAGIDQFFVTDHTPVTLQLLIPGRMSPSTNICFILLALGLLGIDAASNAYKNAAQYLFHFVTLTALITLMGCLLNAPYSGKFSFFSSMAVSTAFAFLLLSTVASAVNCNRGLTSIFTGTGIGNIVARKLFPRMIIILVALGYISIMLERKKYMNDEFGVIISTTSFLVISLFLIWDALTEMNRLDKQRTDAENETQLLNKNLEDKVLQRTLDLKHSNERFIKILNSSPTSIDITRLDNGHYVDINPAFSDMLKFERDELIGHTSAELSIISAEYRRQMVDSLNANGYIKNEDVVLRDKDGNQKHCILAAEILEYNNEQFMMSFIYDITDLKIIENNLQEAKKDLEVLTDKLTNQNKQLLGFAHITSHNLRSPVSNLNLLVHFYKESTTQKDKAELWDNFETVVDHLNTTLEELLETLKIQEDVTKDRENLSFEKVLNDVKNILIGQIKESNAVIKADFTKAPNVLYPKIYLESIIMNLVSNAIKYRSPNRVPEIIISTDNVNGEIILNIKDNGLGIDMIRHGSNLFGMRKTFHRHAEARGLGLYIIKTQIEAMGGEISAESVIDEGAAFKVVFNKNQV